MLIVSAARWRCDGRRKPHAPRRAAAFKTESWLARKLNDGSAGQLEMLLRQIDDLRDGAFSPFSQQPLVRAMLLPLGTFGGTALLQYLFLPGFT